MYDAQARSTGWSLVLRLRFATFVYTLEPGRVAKMPARDALSPGEAMARARALTQRAGCAWNRHDTAAVRANLELAIEMGEPRMRVHYGNGLKILHDLRKEDGTLLGGVRRVVLEDDVDNDGVAMDGGQTEQVRPAASAVTAAPENMQRLQPSAPTSEPDEAARAARLAALEEKARVATERNRRQKAARRQRSEAARLLAAQASLAVAGVQDEGTRNQRVYCPLWDATVAQSAAMVRLIGEVTTRCSNVARQNGLHRKAVKVQYAAHEYEASVLSGTVGSLGMSASKRGEELLSLLGSGLTEEGISALLHRWSQTTVAQGSSEALRSTKGQGPASGTAASPAVSAASSALSAFGPRLPVSGPAAGSPFGPNLGK